ncbi:MAG: 6-carboxytetrahydropterin synthase QueD, partial [Crenarchaeota archaeon]|nr:6-carboxytetrahydropterin synthase QueD [Thermoproteota archaeon]
VEEAFDASHVIPKHSGKCRNLHGHSYKVEVFIVGDQLDENGILKGADFIELKKALRDVVGRYDHRHLNDIMGDDATAENIAKRIFMELKETGIDRLEKVRVWESQKNYAEYWE